MTELPFEFGAGEEARTLDLYLGKVSLYQLSYSRREILQENRALLSLIKPLFLLALACAPAA